MLAFRRLRHQRNPPAPEKSSKADCTALDHPIPPHFRCPISLELMKDPVTLSTGITYDRHSIETWLHAGNRTCPVTKQQLSNVEPVPNHSIRRLIEDWCLTNRSLGAQHIPTPRAPPPQPDLCKLWEGIRRSTHEEDLAGCSALVKEMVSLGKDSASTRQRITADVAGGSRILSAAYASFAASEERQQAERMESILSLLSWVLPLDFEARSHLLTCASLTHMAWLLNHGTPTAKRKAAVMVRELASSEDQEAVDSLCEIEGLLEGLYKLLKEAISPTTTKASLMAVFCLVSTSSHGKKTAAKFIEMGLVPLLLDILAGADKSVCEKALAALDGVFVCEEGREIGRSHALTVPILVKKILRVSASATEFAVSALWKLCRGFDSGDGRDRIPEDALQLGAFQKLLLVLQVGCGRNTKQRATELLKLLNASRASGECIETMDFKQLKRPF